MTLHSAALSVATSITALGLALAGCSEDERLGLRVDPAFSRPGELVELVVVGDDADSASRGSVSVFERRDQPGEWRPVYLLNANTKGNPAVVRRYGGGYATGVGLSPGRPDLVRIPDVPPGVYRISKRVAVLEAPDDDEARTLHGKVRVVGRASS